MVTAYEIFYDRDMRVAPSSDSTRGTVIAKACEDATSELSNRHGFGPMGLSAWRSRDAHAAS